MKLNQIVQGDAVQVLATWPADSVDLIVTSPPYADARKRQYGGVAPDRYVDWFLPIAAQIKRVLKPSGTFILNIKERVVAGERDTYVLELILALRSQQGWRWTEEYVWHKRSCAPGKWPNRFRDAWERCLQFNREHRFKMNQDAVRVPVGDWAKGESRHTTPSRRMRTESQTGAPFGIHRGRWKGRESVYPSNVLHLAAETGYQGHSAVFPLGLPSFFIRLFTDRGDLVADPFAGSGTTGVAARMLGRDFAGIDLFGGDVDLGGGLTPNQRIQAAGSHRVVVPRSHHTKASREGFFQ